MDSMAYKELVCGFSDALQRIEEDIELAADGDIRGDEKIAVITAARGKLIDYERIIEHLVGESKTLSEQFEKEFYYNISCIRKDLERCN
jgi:hypothetical protein